MRAIHYPDYSSHNPYQRLMFEGLEANGVSVFSFRGNTRSLFKKVFSKNTDILHLHWINIPVTTGTVPHAIFSMGLFYLSLILWRAKGTKIVWTLHNLTNHDRRRIRMDGFHSRIVAALAHRVLVHGQSAVGTASAQLRIIPDKISVIHHGNYSGIISPKPLDQTHGGRRFLFAGRIEPYKGIPALLQLFPLLKGPHTLHIAGNVTDAKLRTEIERLAAADNRVSCNLRFVTDQELERSLAWTDVVVLPYRDIFTSGSLMMALTAGRPIIAPRLGLIPDYVDPSIAFLYDPRKDNGLVGALKDAISARDLPDRADKARRRASDFDWSKICASLAGVYRDLHC